MFITFGKETVGEASITKLVDSIFRQAVEQKASDIHIEPQENHTRVRYRIDGLLREVGSVLPSMTAAVISRVKIMSNMDIAEKRLPQDGRLQLPGVAGGEMDVRVSTMPNIHGEKIVARLLDKNSLMSFRLEQIGLDSDNLQVFRRALQRSNGMLLLTGPTGSGKTTTLYAALKELNETEKNIITVEDPVEYVLPGINQTQVNAKAGMTFAVGLRAVLRQDPDIMMVGEIRDKETAEIAVRASLTGHLVLSTMHTNGAVGAIFRLVEMGIESFLVAEAVLAATAQRLVRLICPQCRRSYLLKADAPERAFMGVEPDEPITLYKGIGCDACDNLGYRGRMAIHEVLPMSNNLQALLMKNDLAKYTELRNRLEMVLPLKMDGIRKALKGLTTIDEVIRVTYHD